MVDENFLKDGAAGFRDPPELLGRPREVFVAVMESATPPRGSFRYDVRNECERIPRLLQLHIPHHVARDLDWRTRRVFLGEDAIHVHGRQGKTSVIWVCPGSLELVETTTKADSICGGRHVTHAGNP
jgi:hypothetical protein